MQGNLDRRLDRLEEAHKAQQRIAFREVWGHFTDDEVFALGCMVQKLNQNYALLNSNEWVLENLDVDERVTTRRYLDMLIERGLV